MDFNRLQLTGSQLSLKTKAVNTARLFRLARFPASAFWVIFQFAITRAVTAKARSFRVSLRIVTKFLTLWLQAPYSQGCRRA
jgi:hypothetical protein